MGAASLEQLFAETVGDGQALKQFNDAIDTIKKHVVAHPRRKGPRKATLTIAIEPSIDPETKLNFPQVSYDVDYRVPKIKGVSRQAQIDHRGIVVATTGAKPLQIQMPESAEEAITE